MFIFVLFCIGAAIAFFSIKKIYSSAAPGIVVRGGAILGIGLLMYVATQLMMPVLLVQS